MPLLRNSARFIWHLTKVRKICLQLAQWVWCVFVLTRINRTLLLRPLYHLQAPVGVRPAPVPSMFSNVFWLCLLIRCTLSLKNVLSLLGVKFPSAYLVRIIFSQFPRVPVTLWRMYYQFAKAKSALLISFEETYGGLGGRGMGSEAATFRKSPTGESATLYLPAKHHKKFVTRVKF